MKLVSVTRRDFLRSAGTCGLLAAGGSVAFAGPLGRLIESLLPAHAAAQDLGGTSLDEILRTAPVARYWASTAQAGVACSTCHDAADLARRAIAGVIADPAVRRIFAIFGVSILANQMSRPYLPLLVEEVNGGAANLASAIGLVAGMAALVGALISPVAGPIGDRIGFRRVLAGSLLGAGTMLVLMPLAPAVAALAGLAVVYGALQAATQAMVFGLVAVEVAPERRSATLNLVLLPLYLAGIVGPTIGAVAASAGGVGAPFFAAGAVFLAGGIAVVASLRRSRPPA